MNYKSKYQNCEFAIYLYFNQDKKEYVMLANMFQNIKYLQCKYSVELMNKCAIHCPKIILDKIPDDIVNVIA